MNTDQLIATLVRDVRAIPRYAVERRLAVGIAAGGIITALLVVVLLGVRGDLQEAMFSFPFWMKWSYTISLGVIAIAATAQLARPNGHSFGWFRVAAIPVLLLVGIGIGELMKTPTREWLSMWLGQSWQRCPWLVLLLAIPIFIGLLWSFRRFAPTRLRAAGATAGLTAGAWAATLYCLHCAEVSAIFVLTWYSLGIGLAVLLGALLGPRLLRW